MRKCLFFILLLSTQAGAQSAAEEALILNQELQFLEDSISNVQAAPATRATSEQNTEGERAASLERIYFSDEAADSIKTRSAAPKRRSF